MMSYKPEVTTETVAYNLVNDLGPSRVLFHGVMASGQPSQIQTEFTVLAKLCGWPNLLGTKVTGKVPFATERLKI